MVVLYAAARLDLARSALDGLSVGDALGAQQMTVPDARGTPWPWTDDTQMAAVLTTHLGHTDGRVDQDRLAAAFATACDPARGYGVGAYLVLSAIAAGTHWRTAAADAFGGQGSLGNGAAMRVAPLGAYHAGNPAAAAREATAQAELTHAHPDGVAGAVAVAVAAALAAKARLDGTPPRDLIGQILPYMPEKSGTTRMLIRARRVPGDPVRAAHILGNGSRVTAADTVPFAIWAAAKHLTDYPAALRTCFDAGGDVDTTAAITGGIVAAYAGTGQRPGTRGVPTEWITNREPLPHNAPS
ncbi:ADP-ribosylglycohydrolase family protein [Dactylosporangium sp. AC04546]|uniref:ADP-ribosylglycohydrolase family protein n=1 Tax=Dactylosporangium sp. AC04546 TaxID=2862460 RepID=UPI001EDD4A5A|nr:ADP-ribosylglycohydrolase family protein [Dactylosporangium sp. AC04546]WVK78193.1 ADP-ribosylglycohydrolase family protein [Dactylosporangium sp. AC04546]